jgi:outer membrane protein OmpA-like peptidoglycan-associated protein
MAESRGAKQQERPRPSVRPVRERVVHKQLVSIRHGATAELIEEQTKDGGSLQQRAAVRFVSGDVVPRAPVFTGSRFAHDLSRVPTHTVAPQARPVVQVQFVDRITPVQRQLGVVRQRSIGGGHVIQRDATDFQIRGIFPGASRFPGWVFFDFASADLPESSPERDKLDVFAMPSGDALTLYGYASEEGNRAFNRRLTRRRAEAVADALVSKGHDRGAIATVRRPRAREGDPNYRRWRTVEVKRRGTPSATPSCVGAPTTRTCPSTSDFADARSRALTMIGTAKGLLTGTISGDTRSKLERLFGRGADPMRVHGALESIERQISTHLRAGPRLICATECHPTCLGGTHARNDGTGGSARMLLCPGFFDPLRSEARRAQTLIHESAHATPGLRSRSRGAADVAYGWERVVAHLSETEALQNADSLALIVLLLNGETVRIGPPTPDVTSGFTGPDAGRERDAVNAAVARMQKWITMARSEVGYVYSDVERVLRGRGWEYGWNQDTMRIIAGRFGFSGRPWSSPTRDHKRRVAAIRDRYQLIGRALVRSLNIRRITSGDVVWAGDAYGPSGTIEVGPGFFGLPDLPAQIRLLLTRAVAATRDISPSREAEYVDMADQLRRRRGLGP